jgi:hypothetical protein
MCLSFVFIGKEPEPLVGNVQGVVCCAEAGSWLERQLLNRFIKYKR